MQGETIETVPDPPQELPLAVRESEPRKLDAAQARIEAVANVLHKAYEKASTLMLTADEVAALTAPFEDCDFRTGAAGKENLIYIEHASLRERLNKVIGVGQWSLVVRNRWAETFQYYDKDSKTYQDAQRVYVEAVLLIRGCFAGESVGDMVYYPKNNQINFGDAFEGARSAALRRCAKELGIGLQAWHKDFCEGWFQRRNTGGQRTARPSPKTPPERSEPPKANMEPESDKTLTEPPRASGGSVPESAQQRRERFLNMFRPQAQSATEVFTERGLILAGETIEAIEDSKIARMTRANVTALLDEVRKLAGESQIPDAEVPEEEVDASPNHNDEPWRQLIVPFGKDKGIKLGDLEKKRLWWYFMCYEPKPWTDKQGKLRDPSFADTAFHKELSRYRAEVAAKYDFQPPKDQ